MSILEKQSQFEKPLVKEFEETLRSLPDITIDFIEHEVKMSQGQADTIVHTYVQDKPVIFDVERAIAQLNRFRQESGTPSILPMMVAPAISEHSREKLRQQGIGYWDHSGSLYIKLPGILFYIDRPQPPATRRTITSPYKGANTQVLHALLMEPARMWQAHELATIAKTSTATVLRLFAYLEAQLLVEKGGSGPNTVRRLTNPGALLDAWAEAHTLAEYQIHRYYKWAQSSAKLQESTISVLDRLEVKYALTLASGANLVAPFVTRVDKLSILLEKADDIERIAGECKLELVESGDNVNLLIPRTQSPLMFRQSINDVFVASNIQIYLDLSAWPMRGKEQARHLREERLSF
jgi:Transcriptional regulator, AbiEi antitoxin, Type IV TA system